MSAFFVCICALIECKKSLIENTIYEAFFYV